MSRFFQFGKDFDQVAKLMAKKKMNKDKEQIRNYYYNSFKLLRSTAQFEDGIAFLPFVQNWLLL